MTDRSKYANKWPGKYDNLKSSEHLGNLLNNARDRIMANKAAEEGRKRAAELEVVLNTVLLGNVEALKSSQNNEVAKLITKTNIEAIQQYLPTFTITNKSGQQAQYKQGDLAVTSKANQYSSINGEYLVESIINELTKSTGAFNTGTASGTPKDLQYVTKDLKSQIEIGYRMASKKYKADMIKAVDNYEAIIARAKSLAQIRAGATSGIGGRSIKADVATIIKDGEMQIHTKITNRLLNRVIKELRYCSFSVKSYRQGGSVKLGASNPFRVYLSFLDGNYTQENIDRWWRANQRMKIEGGEQSVQEAIWNFMQLRQIYELTGYGQDTQNEALNKLLGASNGAKYILYWDQKKSYIYVNSTAGIVQQLLKSNKSLGVNRRKYTYNEALYSKIKLHILNGELQFT